jgi:ABC-type glycerol-3-phosphate transport system substrate-binding protein
MNAAITAGSTPDMVIGYPGDLANYYNAGVIVPFDSYINDPKDGLSQAQLAEINQPVMFGKYDGKIIAISAAGSEQVMFYNADMLKAAGFDKPPATWDDFDKVCAAVSKPPDVNCYAFVPSASTFAAWVWSRGGDYTSADQKKAAFDGPAGVDTLKWLKNQADKKWSYQPSGSFGDQTDFGNGKVAFTFSSTAGLPFYDSAVSGSKNPFKWGIAPFPGGANGKQVVDFFNPSFGILKSTAEKQRAAWLFVKFMLSKDGGVDWALATTYFPAAKSTLDSLAAMDDATAKAANPSFAKVLAQYKDAIKFQSAAQIEPASPAWQGARSLVENMITAVFTGKSGADFKATDPDAAAKEGAQRVNDAISQYGK